MSVHKKKEKCMTQKGTSCKLSKRHQSRARVQNETIRKTNELK